MQCLILTIVVHNVLYITLETKLVVGGFHLTYPFSTVTSAKQLSPRQMVIEAHQMIRYV